MPAVYEKLFISAFLLKIKLETKQNGMRTRYTASNQICIATICLSYLCTTSKGTKHAV